MNSANCNRRILIIDDNASIHEDIRAVLQGERQSNELDSLSELLFDTATAKVTESLSYDIDSAYQGQEGLQLVEKSLAEEKPYALAIVDIRMPPGWDGIQTIERIRAIDPNIQIAICTAYSDYSWQNILDNFGINDWLLILKKPFDVVEVKQLACSLTEKWNLSKWASARTQGLELSIRDHAEELEKTNADLKIQVESLAKANSRLAYEIEARRETEDRIRHIAFHDGLTSLPNRMMLAERVDSCIERSKRQVDYRFAVLYCDLDKFKMVNDSLGHRVGDQLLIQIANRLRYALRTSAETLRSASDMVSRLSGDEFVVLLDNVQDVEHACEIAERIQETVCQAVQIEQNNIQPALSVGVAMSSGEYDDSNDLLRDADIALYYAKKSSTEKVSMFDLQMRTKVTDRMNLENDLRQAIKDKQFVVYYQPIISLLTGEIVSVEALVRWQHPHRGLLFPDTFIHIAEETGMIEQIGETVLLEALRQVDYWRNNIPGAENLAVNVNLSPRQLVNENVIGMVSKCLSLTNFSPSALRLEITETAMMTDLGIARKIVNELVALGTEIHLDDFGTGYSSLSILHTLPFSTIKLDRSFVGNLHDELESPTTVQAIVMLANNGGVKLVAEGIETFEQLAELREMDCEFGQGYYFTKPQDRKETEQFLIRGAKEMIGSTTTSSKPVLNAR